MFNETETTIELITPIEGVEITAYYDECQEQWICNDGFNTYHVDTIEEARANLAEAVGFYS